MRPQREQPAVEVLAAEVVVVEEVRLLVRAGQNLRMPAEGRVQRRRPAPLTTDKQEVGQRPRISRDGAKSHVRALAGAPRALLRGRWWCGRVRSGGHLRTVFCPTAAGAQRRYLG